MGTPRPVIVKLNHYFTLNSKELLFSDLACQKQEYFGKYEKMYCLEVLAQLANAEIVRPDVVTRV